MTGKRPGRAPRCQETSACERLWSGRQRARLVLLWLLAFLQQLLHSVSEVHRKVKWERSGSAPPRGGFARSPSTLQCTSCPGVTSMGTTPKATLGSSVASQASCSPLRLGRKDLRATLGSSKCISYSMPPRMFCVPTKRPSTSCTSRVTESPGWRGTKGIQRRWEFCH